MPAISTSGSVTREGLGVPVGDVRSVEERAARAWPEAQCVMIGGWRLRYSPGVVNRRANSVLPIYPPVYPPDPSDVEACIDQVETFYAERNLPARFMISPPAEPSSLDHVLARRGYYIDAPTDVQWAEMSPHSAPLNDSLPVELETNVSPEWMAVYMEGVTDQAEIDKKSDLISRIGSACTLARVSIGGKVTSVGLGVYDSGWTGIFCMHTLEAHRRKGLARAVFTGLDAWGREQGSEMMYLQVERANPGARLFYESEGFSTCYAYHYRTKKIG